MELSDYAYKSSPSGPSHSDSGAGGGRLSEARGGAKQFESDRPAKIRRGLDHPRDFLEPGAVTEGVQDTGGERNIQMPFASAPTARSAAAKIFNIFLAIFLNASLRPRKNRGFASQSHDALVTRGAREHLTGSSSPSPRVDTPSLFFWRRDVSADATTDDHQISPNRLPRNFRVASTRAGRASHKRPSSDGTFVRISPETSRASPDAYPEAVSAHHGR